MNHEVTVCPISGDSKSFTYLDLGGMPLVNNLNETYEASMTCDRYPLKVNYYPSSGLSMLSYVVDPKILFANYYYKSGTSKPYVDHCSAMYDYLSEFVKVEKGDRFVDIGGNDGTLLAEFLRRNKELYTYNVDPSENLAEVSRTKGVGTVTALWGSQLGSDLGSDSKKCKVITSTNVFQHTEPIRDFVVGIRNALADDGVWCLEFPYWKKDLETGQYDQVYHEHIYYYLVTPIYRLLDQEGLQIVDISEQKIHGGTIRLIIRKKSGSTPDAVLRFIREELTIDKYYYKSWGEKVGHHVAACADFLHHLKDENKKIAGFGAAAKGCIFLNSSKIDDTVIDYVVDDTDVKQGKFIPGTGIQVVSRDRLIKDPPDYLLILAHNFADYIMESLRPIYKGKFLVMFPTIQTYE